MVGFVFNCKIQFSGMILSTTTNYVILQSFLVDMCMFEKVATYGTKSKGKGFNSFLGRTKFKL